MEKMYKCKDCGADMQFDAKTQKLTCSHCGSVAAIDNDTSKIVEHDLTKRVLARLKPEEKKTHTMVCSGCGAKLEIDANSTATECPYCGSNYVLASKQEEAILPDGVLPFQVDPKKVQEIFRDWIKHRWLAPGKLRQLYQEGKIQGIYIPYWTFDSEGRCAYTAMGGVDKEEHYKDSEGKDQTRIHTDWFPTSGLVYRSFNDVLIRASDKLDESRLDAIRPFDLDLVASYSPDYFSGYQAECYNIDLETGHKQAREEMKEALKNAASSDVLTRYDRVSQLKTTNTFKEETYKHIVLPVYATSYKFNSKTYSVMINGQSGSISGEYPKSALRVTMLIAIIALLLFGLCSVFFSGEEEAETGYVPGSNTPVYAMETTPYDTLELE